MKKYLAKSLAAAGAIALLGTPIAAHAVPVQRSVRLVQIESWSSAAVPGTQLAGEMASVEQRYPPCVIRQYEPCSRIELSPWKLIRPEVSHPEESHPEEVVPVALVLTPMELAYHRATVEHMHSRQGMNAN